MSQRRKKAVGWFLSIIMVVAAGFFIGTAGADKNGTLAVVRITPDGDSVRDATQIVFQFNRPVVPLGPMDRSASEIPVTVAPAVDCSWRWLDTSTLACELSEGRAFTPATRFTVTMKPGIKDQKGETIPKTFTHVFSTPGPQTASIMNYTFASPVRPILVARFSQEVSKASVERALVFSPRNKLDGMVPVKAEKVPESLVKQYPWWFYDYGSGREKKKTGASGFAKAWIISPARDLAPDATLRRTRPTT